MSKDLVERALSNMLTLASVRVECTSTREGQFEEAPGTVEFSLTVVGEDYHRQGALDESELVDHVRAILGEPTEGLYFRGKEYVRDPRTSDWLSENTRRARRGYVLSETEISEIATDEVKPVWTAQEARRLWLLCGFAIEPNAGFTTVRGGESDSSAIVHLRAEAAGDIPFSGLPNQAAFTDEIRGSLPADLRKSIEAMLPRIPDAFHQTIELWIDRATSLVQRCEHSHESLKSGKAIARHHETRIFSHFNAAELPGPLPE
jgi:hypothetical protein